VVNVLCLQISNYCVNASCRSDFSSLAKLPLEGAAVLRFVPESVGSMLTFEVGESPLTEEASLIPSTVESGTVVCVVCRLILSALSLFFAAFAASISSINGFVSWSGLRAAGA
jgi:hypothetical protein